jgi:hypothetical protein
MSYSADDEARFETYAQVHLRKKTDLTDREKVEELHAKLKGKWLQFFFNIAIIVVFLFMFLNGYTTFGDVFYYFVFALFTINISLILWQRKQIQELIQYLEYRIERGISSDL